MSTKDKTGTVENTTTKTTLVEGDFGNYETLSSDEGEWLHIIDPKTDEPMYLGGDPKKPVRIRAVGIDSPTFKKIEREVAHERLASQRKKFSADAHEAEQLKIITGCITDWENISLNGEVLKYHHGNALKFFRIRHTAFVFEQVNRFISERRNFLKG